MIQRVLEEYKTLAIFMSAIISAIVSLTIAWTLMNTKVDLALAKSDNAESKTTLSETALRTRIIDVEKRWGDKLDLIHRDVTGMSRDLGEIKGELKRVRR